MSEHLGNGLATGESSLDAGRDDPECIEGSSGAPARLRTFIASARQRYLRAASAVIVFPGLIGLSNETDSLVRCATLVR
jgi:hypothetical protein